MVRANVNGGWVGGRERAAVGATNVISTPVMGGRDDTRGRRGSLPDPAAVDVRRRTYRAYAAGTPPSTLSMLPVLFPDRAGEAKCSTAWAMSSGKMLTPSVVRLR